MDNLICLVKGHQWVSPEDPWDTKDQYRFICDRCPSYVYVRQGLGLPVDTPNILIQGTLSRGSVQ